MPSPRLLTLDIETAPNLAYLWSLHGDQHISLTQLVDVSEVLCFAAKWHGDRKVAFRSVYHHGKEDMTATAHALMSECDALIGFNSRAFDVKHLKREMLLAGLTPPPPHADIDLYSVVRKNFKFASAKLQHVATELGLGSKTQHTGFQLWVDCMTGDDVAKQKAWNLMRSYCIQDVRLTERLYDRLLPWIGGHPHAGLLSEASTDCCQRCGSSNLEKRGFSYTTLGKYQRLQCRNCGGWSKDAKRLEGAGARSI